MTAVAVIPARGGSKGVVRKNIAPLAGRPLVAWTIEAARGCADIGRVVVSSDEVAILEVARACGAEALERPRELATDAARPELVLEHALRAIAREALPEYAAYLQPTSPLRTSTHLDGAFRLLRESGADALIAVRETDNKPLKAFVVRDGYLRGLLDDSAPFSNRQQLPPLYMPNGSIYIVRCKDFLAHPTFLPAKTVPFLMPADVSADIDSSLDMEAVEEALRRRP